MAAPLPLTQGALRQRNSGTKAPLMNDLALTGGLEISNGNPATWLASAVAGPSGDRVARSCRRTGPDLTVRIGVKDSHVYLNRVQQMVSGESAWECFQTGFERHGLPPERALLDTVYPLRDHLSSVQRTVSGGYSEGLFPDTVCWTRLRNTWDRTAKLQFTQSVLGFWGPFSKSMIVCPEIMQKQPQDRKNIFEALSGTAKSTHHPHKIDDQHRECETTQRTLPY